MRRTRAIGSASAWAVCNSGSSSAGAARSVALCSGRAAIASRSGGASALSSLMNRRRPEQATALPASGCSLTWVQRASYAKSSKGGKGKKDDDDGPAVSVSELMAQTKDSLSSQMKRSVDWLTEEFAKLRVGRANTEILNRIKVEGAPLANKGSVYVKDSFTLAITPFEKEQTKKIVEALRDADMDLNPQTDGDNIIVRLPKATDEYRQSLLKQATKLNEEVKNSIRRARQGALTDLKKHKDAISKDDMKKLENEVQKITDEYNKKAEQLHKAKEQAISGGGN